MSTHPDTVMKILDNKMIHMFLKIVNLSSYFDVLLTVHLSIILAVNQRNAQNLLL